MPRKKIIVFSIVWIVIIALIVAIIIASNFLIRDESSQQQGSEQKQGEENSIVLNSNGLSSASNKNINNSAGAGTRNSYGTDTANSQQNTPTQSAGNDDSNASETSETISGQQSEAANNDIGSLYSNNGTDLSAFADSIPSMYDTTDNEVKKYKNGGMEQRYSMCKYKNVAIQNKILVSSNSEYERYKVTVKSTMYDIVTMSVGSQTPKEKDLVETWDIVVNNSGKIVYLANKSRE